MSESGFFKIFYICFYIFPQCSSGIKKIKIKIYKSKSKYKYIINLLERRCFCIVYVIIFQQ